MNLLTFSKPWYEEHRKRLRLLGYSPGLWFLAFFLFSLILGWPANVLVQRELSAEFSGIDTPPQTQLLEGTTLHGAGKASAGGKYLTTLSYDEVRSFYDIEMAEHGWSFFEESRNATSGPELEYCKGNYTATLHYYNPSIFDFNYEFTLKSGMISDCALKGGGLHILPFDFSVFLLLASLSWVAFALLIFRATQVMDDDELVQLWRDLHFKLKTGVWSTRVRSVIWLILGIAGTLLSSYKIVMYLSNWTVDALGL